MDSYGLNKLGPPQAHKLKYLIHSQWNCLGRIRRCRLVEGGLSLEGGKVWGFKRFLVLTLSTYDFEGGSL